MRNYIKMRAVQCRAVSVFFPPIDSTFYDFGRTDSELMKRVLARQAQIIAFNNPLRDWTFTNNPPIDWYFMMNRDQLDTLLQSSPDFFYANTVSADGNPANANIPSIAQVNKSPRSTFPSAAGTDGQRLRDGTSKEAGAALNYIGKLYFLTSNPALKTLWEKLKKGKVTVKQALADANEIVSTQ
jgi:hypothetical protein